MILEQKDQEGPSLINVVWTKIAQTGEKLFLIGTLLVVLGFCIEVVAIVGVAGKLSSVSTWIWVPLCMLVYPLAPLSCIRLLFGVSTQTLQTAHAKYYVCVGACDLVAFILALSIDARDALLAFPLLFVAYVIQFILDGRFPQKARRKGNTYATTHSFASVTRESRANVPSSSRPDRLSSTNRKVSAQPSPTECITPVRLAQRVGIWYSPADAKFAQRLRTHLQPEIRDDAIDLWDPDHIAPGTFWQEDRLQAVQSAAVAILLVSADFLACDFIARYELQPLLFRAQCQRTVVLILHVKTCDIERTGLERFQAVNSSSKPLADLGTSERDKVFTRTKTIIRQRLGL
ncbi:MAG TPA: toll/interleukin-1 receptor domain-containing protein [Ktedonobacteraceae bacterium]|nr:toll/interleukin-1 receptor domain-containing protein [Ktedonobacteraceae bacterium]